METGYLTEWARLPDYFIFQNHWQYRKCVNASLEISSKKQFCKI